MRYASYHLPELMLAVLISGSSAFGQQHDMVMDEGPAATRKKGPGFFYRPGKDIPAEQLVYAQLLLKEGKARKARKQYAALVREWHDSTEAVEAQFAYAQLLMKAGKYGKAFDEFQYLFNHYVGMFQYDDVLQHQFNIANHLRTVRRGDWLFFPGFTSPERALPMLERIVENGPTWKGTPQAQYLVADIQYEMKEYEQAIVAYEVVQVRYPRSAFAPQAAFGRAICLYELAKRAKRDEEVSHKALVALLSFRRLHPDSPNVSISVQYARELKQRLAGTYYARALFYDRRGKHPKAALIAYTDFVRRFPTSDLAEDARDRIDDLEIQLSEQSD